MSATPIIDRIVSALTEGGLKGKYTADSSYGIDLAQAFKSFIQEEAFGDDGMEDEFGDNRLEESFFIDWLKEEKGVAEATANTIWGDLNKAFKGEYDDAKKDQTEEEEEESKQVEGGNDEEEEMIDSTVLDDDQYKNYNISVSEGNLRHIEQQLTIQCNDLRLQSESSDAAHDRATYSVLQIGKQNRNQPLLCYLVDSYNRYRIQRRKRLKRRYPDPIIYDQKFTDPEPVKFINDKCKGFDSWLCDYNDKQITEFKNMCQSSISVFFRRLLHKPPMASRTAVIDDSILAIGRYIFQTYSFVEQFVNQNNAPLPAQVDVIILPKKAKLISWDSDDEDENDPDDEIDETEEKDNNEWDIGDIDERLFDQEHKIGGIPIEWGTANRTMMQHANTLLCNKRYQRVVIVIDRREKYNKKRSKDPDDPTPKDHCYAYQPNEDKNCNKFESDPSKFLVQSLMQNSRVCLLPMMNNKNEVADIGINVQIPSCLTLSFHCFSTNEIRVYLCYNGWGTRFFIEDIKYFLPEFFVKSQIEKLRSAFEKD
eukprot:18552_1